MGKTATGKSALDRMTRRSLLVAALALACTGPVAVQATDAAPPAGGHADAATARARTVGAANAEAATARPALPVRPDAPADARHVALQEWQRGYGQALEAHLRQQAARGGARDLLGAALLMPAVEAMQDVDGLPLDISRASADWFGAAAAIRPRDPLVAWLQASGCRPQWPDCDPAAALAFLLETQPDDMTVQLMAVADAIARGDEAAADRHLHAAATAPRRSVPLIEVGQLLLEQGRDVPAPAMSDEVAGALGRLFQINRPARPADAFGVPALGVWAALPVPAFQPLTRLCDEKADLPAQRREDCRKVMSRLAGSPVLFEAMIGTIRSVRLAGDGEDAPLWRERLRNLLWFHESVGRLLSSGSGGALPADYFERFLAQGELAALTSALEANGIPRQAPAGWLPKEPRMRGLVLEGREPAPAVPVPAAETKALVPDAG
jgi:hypothetical protein